MKSRKQVLILTSARDQGWLDTAANSVSQGLLAFIASLNLDADIDYYVSTLDKLDFDIATNAVTIFDRFNKKDMSEYDIVHFRNATLAPDYVRAVAIYVRHAGKQLLDEVDTHQPEYGKLSQMVLYALDGVSVPHTWAAWHTSELVECYKASKRTYPFILKANDGIKGQDNFLITSDEELQQVLEKNPPQQYVLQEFIPNERDFRVLYLGSSDPLVFSRTAAEGSHLNNTSRGGVSSRVSLDEFSHVALSLAKRAATLTRRTVSGVDVLQSSETKQWYVLEVNANPALSSGDLLTEKVQAYKKMIGDIL